MNHRDTYKEGVPSVTDLLKWAGYYDQYSVHSVDYFFKRGHFVEACGTILLQGQELDERTLELARLPRWKPNVLIQDQAAEQWIDYIDGLQQWISQHKIKFIGAQIYVYNAWETYQGTLDWLLEIDGAMTVVDCKTGTCPKATALQTAGYAMGLELQQLVSGRCLQRLGLQLEPGKCTEHWYKDHKDYDAFRILARCWWKHGPQSREYR